MPKKIIPFLTFLFCFTISGVTQTAKTAIGHPAQISTEKKTATLVKHHVIVQLTSNDSLVWTGALNNIKHLKERWGDSVQVELVAHGPGIDMLVAAKTTELEKIAGLKQIGVIFLACENTLKAKKIDKELIIREAGFVPSGVVEIVTRQEQGWSYLKAGF